MTAAQLVVWRVLEMDESTGGLQVALSLPASWSEEELGCRDCKTVLKSATGLETARAALSAPLWVSQIGTWEI